VSILSPWGDYPAVVLSTSRDRDSILLRLKAARPSTILRSLIMLAIAGGWLFFAWTTLGDVLTSHSALKSTAGEIPLHWWWSDVPPTWLAVLIGAVGVWAAIRTLKVVQQQADAATKAAHAARDTVRLNRPFLELTEGSVVGVGTRTDRPKRHLQDMQLQFTVRNYGQTAARIDFIERRVTVGDGDEKITTERPEAMVSPGAAWPLEIYLGPLTDTQEHALVEKHEMVLVQLYGLIIYRDQFGNDHRRRFGWLVQLFGFAPAVFSQAGDNSEEGWGEP